MELLFSLRNIIKKIIITFLKYNDYTIFISLKLSQMLINY